MNFQLVRSFDNYIYANILLLRLKEEGIECYIQDENTITLDPLLSPAIGGMKLMVKESDVIRVNLMLDLFEMEYLKTLSCPNCGQPGIQRLIKSKPLKNLFSLLFRKLLHGSSINETIIYRCSQCGHVIDDLSQLQETYN